MICKFCLRPITEDVLRAKRKVKIENALASTRKRIANGTPTKIKKKLIMSDESIRELKQKGMSYSQLANILGVARMTVYRRVVK